MIGLNIDSEDSPLCKGLESAKFGIWGTLVCTLDPEN